MKTGKDLKELAVHLFDSVSGDEFEFMLKMESQPEFSNLTQSQKDMLLLLINDIKQK